MKVISKEQKLLVKQLRHHIYVMVGQPGGVESVFKSLKANQKDLSDMGKVVEIVTKEGVNIAG